MKLAGLVSFSFLLPLVWEESLLEWNNYHKFLSARCFSYHPNNSGKATEELKTMITTKENHLQVSTFLVPSVLWRCWLGGRKGIQPVKTEWWDTGMVICLERGALSSQVSWRHMHIIERNCGTPHSTGEFWLSSILTPRQLLGSQVHLNYWKSSFNIKYISAATSKYIGLSQ